MGRGRSRVSVRTARSRDTSVLSLPSVSIARRPLSSLSLSMFEDRRAWEPDPERGALTFGGKYARVIVHSRPVVARANTLFSSRAYPVGLQVPVGVRFESPFKVITCVRRKVRRQIMFAKKKAGYGKKQRMPRRNWRSNVSC